MKTSIGSNGFYAALFVACAAGCTSSPEGSDAGQRDAPQPLDVGALDGRASNDSGQDAGSDAPAMASMGCTSGVVMPNETNTGPASGTVFTDMEFTALQAGMTYRNVRLLNVVSERDFPSNVTLIDSLVFGSAGGATCFHLERVRWSGGIFVRNIPGRTCGGTIRDTSIINPYGQALRPACTNPSGTQNTSADACTSGWTVSDSYFASPVPGRPGQHLEAMQGLWDAGGFTFTNVNFFMAGPPNDTQTGDINWHGGNTTFQDCWFTGGAGFRVYAAGQNLNFNCPRIVAAGFGPWYPPHFPHDNPGVSVRCPVTLDGTPLPASAIPGSTCP